MSKGHAGSFHLRPLLRKASVAGVSYHQWFASGRSEGLFSIQGRYWPAAAPLHSHELCPSYILGSPHKRIPHRNLDSNNGGYRLDEKTPCNLALWPQESEALSTYNSKWQLSLWERHKFVTEGLKCMKKNNHKSLKKKKVIKGDKTLTLFDIAIIWLKHTVSEEKPWVADKIKLFSK